MEDDTVSNGSKTEVVTILRYLSDLREGPSMHPSRQSMLGG